jgi:hypothetical protein
MSELTVVQLYIIAVELFLLGFGTVTQHPNWFGASHAAIGSVHVESGMAVRSQEPWCCWAP